MASEKIIDLDESTFKSTLSSTDCPLLIDFWAPWCGPCKAIAPILDELADEMGDKIRICKIDVDKNTGIAAEYNIRSIPTILIIKGGETVEQIIGLANKADIKKKLEAYA